MPRSDLTFLVVFHHKSAKVSNLLKYVAVVLIKIQISVHFIASSQYLLQLHVFLVTKGPAI